MGGTAGWGAGGSAAAAGCGGMDATLGSVGVRFRSSTFDRLDRLARLAGLDGSGHAGLVGHPRVRLAGGPRRGGRRGGGHEGLLLLHGRAIGLVVLAALGLGGPRRTLLGEQRGERGHGGLLEVLVVLEIFGALVGLVRAHLLDLFDLLDLVDLLGLAGQLLQGLGLVARAARGPGHEGLGLRWRLGHHRGRVGRILGGGGGLLARRRGPRRAGHGLRGLLPGGLLLDGGRGRGGRARRRGLRRACPGRGAEPRVQLLVELPRRALALGRTLVERPGEQRQQPLVLLGQLGQARVGSGVHLARDDLAQHHGQRVDVGRGLGLGGAVPELGRQVGEAAQGALLGGHERPAGQRRGQAQIGHLEEVWQHDDVLGLEIAVGGHLVGPVERLAHVGEDRLQLLDLEALTPSPCAA